MRQGIKTDRIDAGYLAHFYANDLLTIVQPPDKDQEQDRERKQRLDALGFIWDVLNVQWEEGFAALAAYKEEHGHCLVKADHTTSEDIKLGVWVRTQRRNQDSLDLERKKRLDALGFIWNVRKK